MGEASQANGEGYCSLFSHHCLQGRAHTLQLRLKLA